MELALVVPLQFGGRPIILPLFYTPAAHAAAGDERLLHIVQTRCERVQQLCLCSVST